MGIEQFLMMRYEILLIATALILLICSIIYKDERRSKIVPIAVTLFFINLIVGFLPIETGIMFGGMFRTSELIIFFKNILNIGVFIVFLQSAGWLRKNHNEFHYPAEYFLIIISSLTGMQYMISSGDFLMLFLGLELATIPVAALVASDIHKNKSAEGGVKLILSAALSSGILLFGISILYATTGTVYFDQILNLVTYDKLQILSFIFIFTGIAFKISIVPFHLWTADVYEGAPVNITSYLSVISKASAVLILMIVLYRVFGQINLIWSAVIYVTAILTMTIGNLFAIRQKNLKRYLAFSSIAQAGFILLGVICGTSVGLSSVIYFLLIYIFSNLGAFGVVAIISNATGKEEMDDYNGLYKTNPKLSFVMMLSLFSLAGIPPVAGFFGKFFLFTAAAKQGYYLLVFIAVVNATISLYYYLLIVKAMFINENENPIEKINSDLYAKAGLVLCVIGIVFIGFFGAIFDYINSISLSL